MSDFEAIRDWLKTCPTISELFSIFADGQDGANLITPFSSSERAVINDGFDVTGAYEAEVNPLSSVYEEYQVDCFRRAYPNDDSYNILAYDDVKEICRWIEAQNELRNFPDIGENIVRVEPKPFLPQVRFKDIETGLAGYFFTLRITYVNKMKEATIRYDY